MLHKLYGLRLLQVTKLYIRNLDINMGVEELRNVLFRLLPAEKIVHIHKILDYAFVHFARRQDAEVALTILQGKILIFLNYS